MLSPFRAEGYGNTIPAEIHRALYRDRPPPELYVSTTGADADWVVKLIDVQHAFLKGHQIMVQVQSSLFPLFDRNPQTFCNIRTAGEANFLKATHRVYHTARYPSAITFMVPAK